MFNTKVSSYYILFIPFILGSFHFAFSIDCSRTSKSFERSEYYLSKQQLELGTVLFKFLLKSLSVFTCDSTIYIIACNV